MISPMGLPGSPIRKRADQVIRYLVNPALQAAGYKNAVRADHIDDLGMISAQVIHQILNDDLVIADLTGGNPNVFYELAVRHACGKPCIQLMAAGEPLPFDLADQRTIFFDHTDLDSLEEARQALIRAIITFQKVDPKSRRTRSILSPYQLLDPDIDSSMTDLKTLQGVLGDVLGRDGQFTSLDLRRLITDSTSPGYNQWARDLIARVSVWLPDS
jgi:hypothetical protein